MQAGNQSVLKRHNQRAIIDYIVKNGATTRTTLATALGVTKPTVSSNIASLLEASVLTEVGFVSGDVGKNPILVDFNKDFKYILALDVTSYRTRNVVLVSACNLFCEIIFTEEIDLGEHYGAEAVEVHMPRQILELLNINDIMLNRIGAVVATAPSAGFSGGVVMFECANGESVNLAQIVADTFNQPIVVKNDINLAAIGEAHFGVGKDVSHLLFVWAGLGVGGGIILNSDIYEGPSMGGGELAYTTIYSECTGRNEFFKDILSFTGIRSYIRHYDDEARESLIADKLFSPDLTLEDIIQAEKKGDYFCHSLACFMANKIATIVANLAEPLDLQMVIIGGDYSRFGDVIINTIRKYIAALPITATIVASPKFENSAMYGAFKVGVDYVISSIID